MSERWEDHLPEGFSPSYDVGPGWVAFFVNTDLTFGQCQGEPTVTVPLIADVEPKMAEKLERELVREHGPFKYLNVIRRRGTFGLVGFRPV